MPSVRNLVDKDTWRLLSDPLFCSCDWLLEEDIASSNPVYLERRTPNVTFACLKTLFQPENTFSGLIKVLCTGELPANPRLGEFLKYTGPVAPTLKMMVAREPALSVDDAVAIEELLDSLITKDDDPGNKAVGVCHGIVLTLTSLGVSSVNVPDSFWDEVWDATRLVDYDLLRLLDCWRESIGQWWLDVTLSEETASRFLLLTVQARAKVLEQFVLGRRTGTVDEHFAELLTAHESV